MNFVTYISVLLVTCVFVWMGRATKIPDLKDEVAPIVKFLGLADEYKGELGLHVPNRKIVFFGNDDPFHVYFDGITRNLTYLEIVVKNQRHEILKDIFINGTTSMLDVITNYNVNKGIDYEYGYVIEIKMIESYRTHFIINGNTNYIYYDIGRAPGYTFENKTFKIINDQLLSYEFYEQKYLRLLVEWKAMFSEWDKEMKRQMKDYVPQLNAEEKNVWKNEKRHQLLDKLHALHQDVHIISNGEEIQELRKKITRLERHINDEFNKLYGMLNEVKKMLDGPTNGCSTGIGLISPIGLIPGVGMVLSAVTGIISAVCAIDDV